MTDTSIRTRAVNRTSPFLAITTERRSRSALATVVLLAAAAPFVVRLVHNIPGTAVGAVSRSYETVVLAATVIPALVAVVVAIGTADPLERGSLLGLAVFAPLPLVANTAYLPAAVAVTTTGSILAWRRLTRERTERSRLWVGRRLIAGAAITAVGASLAATVGLAPVSVREAGTVLTLLTAGAAGLATDSHSVDWAAGAVAASLVYAAGTAAPYVTGAVALVAGGVVGASLPLLAGGVGGIVAATVASLRRGAFGSAAGVLLLLVSGVPVTVPRAMAVVLGVAFVLGGESV